MGKKKEEMQIIDKINRIKRFNIITIASIAILFFGYLISNSMDIEIPKFLFYAILVGMPVLNLILRSCPRCGYMFGRSLIPVKCPSCNARLQ